MSLRWPSVILLMLRMHTEYLVSGEEFQACWLPVHLKQQLCMLQQYQPQLKSLLYNYGNGGSVTAEHGFGSDPLEVYAGLQRLREHDFFHRYPCFWKHPSWWWCPLQRSSTVFCITNKCLFTACIYDWCPAWSSLLHFACTFGSVIVIHVSFQQRNVPCTLRSTSLGTATRYWTRNSCVRKVCAC